MDLSAVFVRKVSHNGLLAIQNSVYHGIHQLQIFAQLPHVWKAEHAVWTKQVLLDINVTVLQATMEAIVNEV